MPGSPATPDHPLARRIFYAVIGVFVALTAGLSNGLLLANLPQIQGSLGLTQTEAAWLTGAYSMTNICTGFVLIKARQQFGLQRVVRIFLVRFVLLSGLQIFAHSFQSELMLRAAAGVIAGGFTPLGFFYIMQALPRPARMKGFIIGLGMSQLALPLARAISPLLLSNGNIANLSIFEFGLALASFAAITLLPIPPSERADVFEPLDFLTIALFVPGMALLTAALVQGRIVWWATPWIGYALAGATLLIGAAMMIEHNRANPMLNTRWMGSSAIIRFAVVAAAMRILLSEQNYGAIGLMTALGMGQDQLVGLFWVISAATLAGLVASVLTLNTQDLLRPVVASVALITVGAFLDADASNLTRPAQLFASQAIISFAAIYFIGPTMMSGVVRAISKGPSHMVSFSAVFGISQALGGLIGNAFLGTWQYDRVRYHLASIGQAVKWTDPTVAARVQQLGGAYGRVIGDPALRQAEGALLLNQQAIREANVLAYNEVFFAIGLLGLAVLVWLGGRWLYYRWQGINPLAEDLAAMQTMMASRQ